MVHGNGVEGERRRPACTAEAKCQVDVLPVHEHAFVETRDLLPGPTSVGTGRARRPEDER